MPDDGQHTDTALIRAVGLRKQFGDFTAVDGIDFPVQPGEAFGFLGPNGAGKSSTMRMIGCTSPISGGSLRLFGLDPATNGRDIRRRLGVVPQTDSLDNELTVEGNLRIYGRCFDLSCAEARKRAAELLEFVQLSDRAKSRVEPLFYLLSIRGGAQQARRRHQHRVKTLTYAEFVAPALMAASAMNGAMYDATMNVFFKLKHARVYDAVLATPMSIGDVALGEITWALLRGLLYAIAFLVTMTLFGLVNSPWMLLSVPICVLIGFAFASVGMAATTYSAAGPTWSGSRQQ